jgi:hypothetical protein
MQVTFSWERMNQQLTKILPATCMHELDATWGSILNLPLNLGTTPSSGMLIGMPSSGLDALTVAHRSAHMSAAVAVLMI